MRRKKKPMSLAQKRALDLGRDIRRIRGMKATFSKFFKADVAPYTCKIGMDNCRFLENAVRTNYAA